MQIRIRKPSPLTLAFIVCGIVWTYLAMTSQMAIMHDSEGYQKLGYLLQEDGFLAYFKTGPRREPLYPLFISWCISLSKTLEVSYKSILIIGQFLILGITQWLIQKALELFQIDQRIQAGILIYFGLSAAMITSALRLYSEIVTYPFIVLAILLSCWLLGAITQENNNFKKTILLSIGLGLNFFMLTMAKVAFQAIVPLYGLLVILCFSTFFKNRNIVKKLITAIIIAGVCYGLPVHCYKNLNKTYNGQYTIRGPGGWALYGNTARRMGNLTWNRFIAAATYGGDGWLCSKITTPKDCMYWSYVESDKLGAEKRDELFKQGLEEKAVNKRLVTLSLKKALSNPFQYILLTLIEGTKMFFWESFRDGYVIFPKWLHQLSLNRVLEFPFVFITSILTMLSYAYSLRYLWKNRKNINRPCHPFQHLLTIILLVTLYIGIYSIFFILRRYAFSITPLFLIMIAFVLNTFIQPKTTKE